MKVFALVCLLFTSLAISSYHNFAFLELRDDKYPVHKVLNLIPIADIRDLCLSLGKAFNEPDASFCEKSSQAVIIDELIRLIDLNNAIDKVFDFLASKPERLLNIEVLKGIFAIDIPKSKKLVYVADAFVRKLFDQEDDEETIKDEIDHLTSVDEIKEKLEEQAMNYMIIVMSKEGKNVRDGDLDYLLNLKNYISLAIDTVFYHNGTILKQVELKKYLSGLDSAALDSYYHKAQKLSKDIMNGNDGADDSSQVNYILSQASVLPLLASPEFIRRVDL